MSKHQNPRDAQEPHTGKVANDTNKMGDQDATQWNQGQRTPRQPQRSRGPCGWQQPVSKQTGHAGWPQTLRPALGDTPTVTLRTVATRRLHEGERCVCLRGR